MPVVSKLESSMTIARDAEMMINSRIAQIDIWYRCS